MSEVVSTNAIAAQRLKVYRKMPVPLQKIADYMSEKFSKETTALLLANYDVGAYLIDVTKNESKFGHDAMSQLAEYFPMIKGGRTTLYGLRDFAASFSREFVTEWSSKPMKKTGAFLTLSHWLALRKLDSSKDRVTLLKRTIEDALSAADLENEITSGAAGARKNIRQGGRNARIPDNPFLALQSTCKMGNKFDRFGKEVERKMFSVFSKLSEAKITPKLAEKLEETHKIIEHAVERGQQLLRAIEDSAEHAKRVLSRSASHEKAPGKAPGKPATRAPAGKHMTNGRVKSKHRAAGKVVV